MRPAGRPADDPDWPGTVQHSSRGLCGTCWTKRRASLTPAAAAPASAGAQARQARPSLRRLAGLETDSLVASPSVGREVVWPWRMLPGGMSMVQQELECLADLADQLRSEGLVAMSRPRRSVRHGLDAALLLTLVVRPATPEEARALGHEPHPAQAGEAAESAGVAA
ncbi:hypothetical protein CWT12_06590 [Actinomyces sp. 432]|uniref:hypothetical protein n=1 Tax=Actinomyces sp. 432 TaxID=2057798 RepID=UPI001373A6E6|nr:hypothetical protein [Actinomyces sp. 432]QHO91056.1 hypothetical protein CWT12_06590 [Actinomyces sp. 432]